MKKLVYDLCLEGDAGCYEALAKVQKRILDSEDPEITLMVRPTGGIDRTAVFTLSTLPLLARVYGKRLRLRISPELYQIATKMDIDSFYQQFGQNAPVKNTNAAFGLLNSPDDIIEIVSHITKEAPVKMSDALQDVLVSKMGEIYLNAFSHSESKWVVGGKYFKSDGVYCFCCYDTGIGIPEKVNRYLAANGKGALSDAAALQWAMAPGNSTAQSKTAPRGAGFQTLHSFAQKNKGAIRICTGGVYYTFQNGRREYAAFPSPFSGTMFEMEISADNNRKYILKSEAAK